MVCPKCNNADVSVQVSTTEKSKGRHSIVYWVFIGWWLHPLMWIFLTLPMLIWRLIRPNSNSRSVTHTNAVCQTCGHTWKV